MRIVRGVGAESRPKASSRQSWSAAVAVTVAVKRSAEQEPLVELLALLIPGGFGTRQEIHNRRLHEFVRSLPNSTLLTSVCTGSWVYGKMGLLDGLPATNRKEPDNVEKSLSSKEPIDRLAESAPACKISRARVVDAGRIVTAGGITSGMEMGIHLLRRAGYDEGFVSEVAHDASLHPREERSSLDLLDREGADVYLDAVREAALEALPRPTSKEGTRC